MVKLRKSSKMPWLMSLQPYQIAPLFSDSIDEDTYDDVWHDAHGLLDDNFELGRVLKKSKRTKRNQTAFNAFQTLTQLYLKGIIYCKSFFLCPSEFSVSERERSYRQAKAAYSDLRYSRAKARTQKQLGNRPGVGNLVKKVLAYLFCLSRKFTQQQTADVLGVSVRTIKNWCKELKDCSPSQLAKMIQWSSTSHSDFFSQKKSLFDVYDDRTDFKDPEGSVSGKRKPIHRDRTSLKD